NQAEDGRRAFDGASPHIGGGLMPLNVRFAQPGRAWGDQVDHLYPAYDFPFGYGRVHDPLTGRTQGVLDRCTATATCPPLFDVAPPPSVAPRIADATLVAPDQVRFPPVPANEYGRVPRPAMKFLRVHNPLHVLDFGLLFNAADSSGVITHEPPRVGTASYGVL